MKNSSSAIEEMTGNILFEHFATLATAPGGIARLRELILQLAVQGKLGTQGREDEAASVLLKKITAEKKQLVSDGKIRQEQLLEPIENSGSPNNLPDKWCLSKLGEYCLVIMGQSPESKFYNENGSGLPFYQGKSEFGRLFPKPRVWCENPLKIAQKNDILISVRAPVGPTNICPSESCVGRGLAALRSLSGTSHFFLLYSLRAYEKLISEMGVGSTFSAISKKDLDNFVIAVPPVAEQYRIIAKVDRLMALCDELEARQQQERAGCLKLGIASLAGLQNATPPEVFGRQWTQVCDAFDLILDCPENVKVLRQTILQLAVQGRLVRQEPGNEPASVLLEIIRKKKDQLIKDGALQKEKPLKYANGDEVPFQIPKEWVWTYFGQITFNRDGTRIPIEKAERATRHGAYDYYGASGVIDTIDDYLFDKPLLLIGEDGANLVNRSTPIAFIAHGKYWVNNHAHVLDGISLEFLRYLEIYINSIDLKPYLTGMAQPKMNQAKMNSIPVPLPPLAEQHRIVAMVDALMALCDALESRLKERAGVQERLAGAVVKQVAG